MVIAIELVSDPMNSKVVQGMEHWWDPLCSAHTFLSSHLSEYAYRTLLLDTVSRRRDYCAESSESRV